ncbi:serine hydrolase, partial [Streptomyces sp. NPDC050529]|uniref:serine hydrolase n=1 Tax=Streptomyces sp. NPDC050529 TaxID=3365624 RepID=UPI0037AED901
KRPPVGVLPPPRPRPRHRPPPPPQLRLYGYTGPATIREHLATARATAEPGSEFRYENGNAEALAEVLRRVTGTTTSALLSEMIWSRIGAEEDAYYLLDSEGSEAACGGFSATARDLARLGEMIRCGGAIGDRQIVPEAVASTIVSGVPDGYAHRVRFPAAPPRRPPPSPTTTSGGSRTTRTDPSWPAASTAGASSSPPPSTW